MKLKILCVCAMCASILLSSCSGKKNSVYQSSPQPSANEQLIWYLPSYNNYEYTSTVNEAVNEVIHEVYPNINISLNFVNMYEYASRLSIYLSAGEQADIVWVNDDMLPYINYPSESIYKFLDAPIKSWAPAVQARLEKDDPSLYKIYDKNYFIPVTRHSDGLIPFIKIPKELAKYMDIDAFINAVSEQECASEKIFDIINDYLQNLSQNNLIMDGIELAKIYDIFPMIGYESFISTSNLIGYSLSDQSHAACDMLNAPSTQLSYAKFNEWYNNGYIKENTSIIYKSSGSQYKYILSGAWGYNTDDKTFMMIDQNTDEYIYIAADKKYHPTKLFSSSALIIPTSSKFSESALKIINMFYEDPRLYNLVTFGIEGESYFLENNKIHFNNSSPFKYSALEGIVPAAKGSLSSVSEDCIFLPQMEVPQYTAGMFIPSATTDFRRILFEYTDTYSVAPYSLSLPDNSNSDIAYLLDCFNNE